MADEYGAAIPLWAQRLLTSLLADSAELEPRIEEMKASTAAKLVTFKGVKEKKEREQEQAILAETVRVNAEILKRRESVTNDSSKFRETIETKLEETRQMETLLHSKSSTLPKMTETLIRLQSELEGLKKQEETLNQAFIKAKASVSEESKKATLSDPTWADMDLLEPVYKTPEVPAPKFTAKRADTAQRKNVLARPTSSLEPRPEIAPHRLTRAGKAEIIRILLGERPLALVESFFLPYRYTLQAILETFLKDDPLDPIEHSTKLLFARGLQNIHTFYGKDVELIEWLVKLEVSRANEAKQVFAEGTVTHNIISTFALRYGSTYLKDTIRDIIFRILKEDKAYELNPDKVVKNVEWVDINVKSVKSLAYDMLIEIVGSSFKLPIQLRKIMILLRTEMVRKFPQDGFNMIARFLFDGFFCKAIEKPEEANIDIKDVNEKLRPLLRTLSGMMARVARNEPFSEDLYLPLNEFVSNYLGLARKFLTDSIKPPEREIWATLTPCTFTACIEDIKEAFSKVSMMHIETIAKRVSELDGHRLYSYTAVYQHHERLKILQDYAMGDQLLTMEKNHPFADELFEILFEEDGSLIDSIAAVATPKADFDCQPMATAIVTCSLYKDPTGAHAEFLIRSMLRKEMSAFSNASPRHGMGNLLNGFGAYMYAAFAKVLGSELLVELIPPLLENVRKGKGSKLDKKGCGVLATFLDTVAHALPRVPVPMWKLASFLTRQLMDPGPSLFLVRYIGTALENPNKYMTKMAEGKDKDKFQKSLAGIRLFLTRVSTAEPLIKVESKYYSEANPIIKEARDAWIAANDGWAPKEPAAASSSVAPTISYVWEDARAASKLWMDFVEADSSFELLLSKSIKTDIAFTLGDLFFGWAVTPGPRCSSIVVDKI